MATTAAAQNAPLPPPPAPPFDLAKLLGEMWDPLEFFEPRYSKVWDEEGFRNLQMAELKHGRVAMMAVTSVTVELGSGLAAVGNGLAAVTVTTALGTYGFVALFLLSGVVELGVSGSDPAGLGMAMFAALGIVVAWPPGLGALGRVARPWPWPGALSPPGCFASPCTLPPPKRQRLSVEVEKIVEVFREILNRAVAEVEKTMEVE